MQILGFDSEVELNVLGSEEIPPTATFVAHVKETLNSAAILLTLTTENGGIEVFPSELITNPEEGYEYKTLFVLHFVGTETKDWRNTKVVTDVVRVDVEPDQYLGFQLTIDFVKTITRL